MTERDRLIAHEAGHAAAAVLLRAAPTCVDIRDDGGTVSVDRHIDRDNAHDLLTVALAGRIGEDEPDWPPAWPPSAIGSQDERQAALLAGFLSLDAAGWRIACEKALKLAASRPFIRLERAFADALQRTATLDAKAIAALTGEAMHHVLLKATVTPDTDPATGADLGTFTAVISTEAIDREKDVVRASGMVDALTAWTRPIPLAWNHSLAPDDIFGAIDPASVHEVNGEVVASGEVDLDTARGAQAWRLMKARTVGFSFAYMITDAVKRADGVCEIRKLDVFEISAAPAPVNNTTRVVSTKATDDEPLSHTELERQLVQRGIIARTLSTADRPHASDPPATDQDVTDAARAFTLSVLNAGRNGNADDHHDDKALTRTRAKSTAPVRVATFDC